MRRFSFLAIIPFLILACSKNEGENDPCFDCFETSEEGVDVDPFASIDTMDHPCIDGEILLYGTYEWEIETFCGFFTIRVPLIPNSNYIPAYKTRICDLPDMYCEGSGIKFRWQDYVYEP